MREVFHNITLKTNNFSKERILSRFFLILEKLINFLLTAYMANKLSYSDIGFWFQCLYCAGLYTSLTGFNISNGLIAIVPRINNYKKKFELIFNSGIFLLCLAASVSFLLLSLKDTIANLFFNNILDLKVFLIILSIGFCEMILDFVLYSFRSVKNFKLSNYVLSLKILPRILVFIGVYNNNINLMLYVYSGTFLFSCLFIFLKLYLSNKNYILSFFTEKINKLNLFGPKPYSNSLFIISKKSIFATIMASLFFFFARRIILSNVGLNGVGEFSLAISAGAIIMFLANFVGFTFYPYISNLAINEKKIAFKKTNKLSLGFIFTSIFISLFLIILKIIFNNKLDIYPFTINSLDLLLAFLGYGFLSAYQICQPFAFALTDNIKVIQIELISSIIAFVLYAFITKNGGFSIHTIMLTFCFYTFGNYLQATNRNFKILNETPL